jgi:hypothetical protein
MGADIGSETTNGGTVLWWARRVLPEDHEIIHYLESIGAPDSWSGEEESEEAAEEEEDYPADDTTDLAGFEPNE